MQEHEDVRDDVQKVKSLEHIVCSSSNRPDGSDDHNEHARPGDNSESIGDDSHGFDNTESGDLQSSMDGG